MNIVQSTANKCRELEKRLDNALLDKSLKVTEIKQNFENLEQSDEVQVFKVLSISEENTSTSLVVQGEIEVWCTEATNFNLALYVDGFEVYYNYHRLTAGDTHKISLIRALSVVAGAKQDVELRVWLSGGGVAYLKGYNFFVWGYGTSFDLGEVDADSRLSGATENGRYVLNVVVNKLAYGCYLWDFPEELKFDDFNYLGEAVALSTVCFPIVSQTLADYGGDGSENETEEEGAGEARELPYTVIFAISPDGGLYMFEGEIDALDYSLGVKIADGVSCVASTYAKRNGVAVVAYAVGNSVFYFTFDGETRSEAIEIFSFKEEVLELAFVQKCESTTFLVVGLSSGKNYLFSSVTEVVESEKSSKVNLLIDFEFE